MESQTYGSAHIVHAKVWYNCLHFFTTILRCTSVVSNYDGRGSVYMLLYEADEFYKKSYHVKHFLLQSIDSGMLVKHLT